MPVELTPAQRAALDQLAKPKGGNPEWDPATVVVIREHLDAALASATGWWAAKHGGELPELRVTKWDVAANLGCQRKAAADRRAKFQWDLRKARGSVAGQMVQTALFAAEEVTPGEVFVRARARLEREDRSLGGWLRSLSAGELMELRAEAVSWLTRFQEVFPPVNMSWRPAVEVSISCRVGPFVFNGRVDLQLGRPEGNRAGKVVIDFKSGRRTALAWQEVEHYALLDALSVGVPPRAVGLFSLAEGQLEVRPVDEQMLWRAADRLSRAVDALVQVEAGGQPSVVPGQPCRWCPVFDQCGEGQRWVAAQAGDEPEIDEFDA